MVFRSSPASRGLLLAALLATTASAQEISPPLAPGAVSAGKIALIGGRGNAGAAVRVYNSAGAVRPGEPVLFSYGRMHTTVKPGDAIHCTGGPARGGQSAMIASLIKLAAAMIKS